VYQAGLASNHRSANVDSALKRGVRRVTNCCSILQTAQLMPRCRSVCFEVNPLFQLASRASKGDFVLWVGPVLLGMGVPVSVGCDYGGLLGGSSASLDLAVVMLNSMWSLKHLKLLFLNSLEHAAAPRGQKVRARRLFEQRWGEWMREYVSC
jgi:hypothetical protein